MYTLYKTTRDIYSEYHFISAKKHKYWCGQNIWCYGMIMDFRTLMILGMNCLQIVQIHGTG